MTCIGCDTPEDQKPRQRTGPSKSLNFLKKNDSPIPSLSQIPSYFSSSDPAIFTPRALELREDKLSILVIEDNTLIWKIFENSFKRTRKKDFMDFRLLFSTTGEEGIWKHMLHGPCLTFIDHHLAGKMNGQEVVKTLKQNCESLKYPPGYLVAFSSDPGMNASMGANSQIPKMGNIALFRKVVRQVLDPIAQKKPKPKKKSRKKNKYTHSEP